MKSFFQNWIFCRVTPKKIFFLILLAVCALLFAFPVNAAISSSTNAHVNVDQQATTQKLSNDVSTPRTNHNLLTTQNATSFNSPHSANALKTNTKNSQTSSIDTNGYFHSLGNYVTTNRNRKIYTLNNLNGSDAPIPFDYTIGGKNYKAYLRSWKNNDNDQLTISNTADVSSSSDPDPNQHVIEINISNSEDNSNQKAHYLSASVYSTVDSTGDCAPAADDPCQIWISYCIQVNVNSYLYNEWRIGHFSTKQLGQLTQLKSNKPDTIDIPDENTTTLFSTTDNLQTDQNSNFSNATNESQLPKIKIITGNHKITSQDPESYRFCVFAFFDSNQLALNPNKSTKLNFFYMHVSKNCFAAFYGGAAIPKGTVITSGSDNNSSIFSLKRTFKCDSKDFPNFNLVDVACQTILPHKWSQGAHNWFKSDSGPTNDEDVVYSTFKNYSKHEIIASWSMSQLNQCITKQSQESSDINLNSSKTEDYMLFFTNETNNICNKTSRINAQIIDNFPPSISSPEVSDIQFDDVGGIYFLVTTSINESSLTFLCRAYSFSGFAPIVIIVYQFTGPHTYFISSPFCFDSVAQINAYNHFELKNNLPKSNIFFISFNNSIYSDAIYMCPVNSIPDINTNSHNPTTLDKYAVIDDLDGPFVSRKELSGVISSWALLYNQNTPQLSKTDVDNNTKIFINAYQDNLSVPSLYCWTWISADQYFEKLQPAAHNSNQQDFITGVYYDSNREKIERSIPLIVHKGWAWQAQNPFENGTNHFDYDNQQLSPNLLKSFNYYSTFLSSASPYSSVNDSITVINSAGPLTLVFDIEKQDSVSISGHDKAPVGANLFTFDYTNRQGDYGLINSNTMKYQFQISYIDGSSVKKRIAKINVLPNISLETVQKGNNTTSQTDNFLQYPINQKTQIKTNFNKVKTWTDQQGQVHSFHGDLVQLPFDMSSAGHLSTDKYQPFQDKDYGIGFFYFLNAKQVTINLHNLFWNTGKSEHQIGMIEILPLSRYDSHSGKFIGNQSTSDSFYIGQKGSTKETYEVWNNHLINNYTNIILKNSCNQTNANLKQHVMTSGCFSTFGTKKASLYLLNFYSIYYTSAVSILVQVGGNGAVKNVDYLTHPQIINTAKPVIFFVLVISIQLFLLVAYILFMFCVCVLTRKNRELCWFIAAKKTEKSSFATQNNKNKVKENSRHH